jgi:hypothetical protein
LCLVFKHLRDEPVTTLKDFSVAGVSSHRFQTLKFAADLIKASADHHAPGQVARQAVFGKTRDA